MTNFGEEFLTNPALFVSNHGKDHYEQGEDLVVAKGHTYLKKLAAKS